MNEKMDNITQQVQTVLEQEPLDVRERVRRITLTALSSGQLDKTQWRQVMDAVLQGGLQGRSGTGSADRQALREAVRGLDEALAAAAEATQLALQEAAGRSSEFSNTELKRVRDDLQGLEALFIDTLSQAADKAGGHAATTLRELAAHGRHSGTAVGRRVTEALAQVSDSLLQTARSQVETGRQSLQSGGALLANLAAGFLAGIADRLQPDARADANREPPRKDADD